MDASTRSNGFWMHSSQRFSLEPDLELPLELPLELDADVEVAAPGVVVDGATGLPSGPVIYFIASHFQTSVDFFVTYA